MRSELLGQYQPVKRKQALGRMEDWMPAESSPLENHCWVREAETEDGRQGWALIDSDGDIELFTEERSEVFFYIAKHRLVHVFLN